MINPLAEYQDKYGKVKIKIVFDGYVVFRRPRAMPYLTTIEKFLSKFAEVKP